MNSTNTWLICTFCNFVKKWSTTQIPIPNNVYSPKLFDLNTQVCNSTYTFWFASWAFLHYLSVFLPLTIFQASLILFTYFPIHYGKYCNHFSFANSIFSCLRSMEGKHWHKIPVVGDELKANCWIWPYHLPDHKQQNSPMQSD